MRDHLVYGRCVHVPCLGFAKGAGIPTLVTEHDLTVSQTLEHRLRQAGIMLLEGQ